MVHRRDSLLQIQDVIHRNRLAQSYIPREVLKLITFTTGSCS